MKLVEIVFVLSLLGTKTGAFNLEIKLASDATVSSATHDGGAPVNSTDGTNPSYFGYSLALVSNANGTARLSIGGPLKVEGALSHSQEPSGEIQTCDVTAKNFSSETLECRLSHPHDRQPGDYFGLSVPLRSDGNALACSPTRENCEDLNRQPGICFASKDFGRTWGMDGRTKNLSCPVTTVEVLFVLDGSGSVGSKQFENVKKWVINITSKLDIGNGTVRVGIVQYSHYDPKKPINKQSYIVTEIAIGEFGTFDDFKNATGDIRLHGFTTHTGSALQKVAFDFNSTKNYGKKTNKQVMILLTDGRANSASLIPAAANHLRDMGVVTFAIGVEGEDSISYTELELIANGGVGNERVSTVDSFEELQTIVGELRTAILSYAALEGTNDGSVERELESAEVGLAATYSKQNDSLGYREILYQDNDSMTYGSFE